VARLSTLNPNGIVKRFFSACTADQAQGGNVPEAVPVFKNIYTADDMSWTKLLQSCFFHSGIFLLKTSNVIEYRE